MDEIAKAAKYLKHGGYVGIALGGTASVLKVREVCQAGETQACRKIDLRRREVLPEESVVGQ